MYDRIEAVARAICKGDDLDPDAVISVPDYTESARSGNHIDRPQWQTKVPEATRFVLMHEALTTSATTVTAPVPDFVSPASTHLD